MEDRVYLRVNNIFPKEDHSSLIVILCIYCSVFYENKETDIGIYFIEDLLKIKSSPAYNNCKILPGGDCNERTSNHNDFLMCDNIKNVPAIENCYEDLNVCDHFCRIRKNQEKETNTSMFGKQLLNSCSVYVLHFLNGRLNSDQNHHLW